MSGMADISIETSGDGINISAVMSQSGVQSLFVSDVTTRAQFVERVRRLLHTIIADKVSPSDEILANLETATKMANRALEWRGSRNIAWYSHDQVLADAFVGLGHDT